MKKTNFSICILVAAIASIGVASTAMARPLSGELQSLMMEHPMIKSARKQVEAAEFGIAAAKSGWLPKVNLVGDMGNERIETALTTNEARRKAALTIEQNLFAGGRTQAGVAAAEIDFAIQENSFDSTVQGVLLEGLTAYIQVVRYKTLLAIAERNEATTARQLSLEDMRVRQGGGIAVDALQAKTRLQIAKERRVFYGQGLRDAEANYRQVFGRSPQLDDIQDLDMPASRMPATIDMAMQTGLTTNPTLREALLQSRKSQKLIDIENSGMYPSVDLVGLQNSEKNVSQTPKRDEVSVLLKLNWNLFAGFETTSRVGAETARHGAAVDREVAVRHKMEEFIQMSWNQLINGKEREDLLENAVGISYEVMLNRKRLRDAGKESAINVLDSEMEYFSVLSNKINASYDTRLGGFRLLSATGMLTPETLGLATDKFKIPVKPLVLNFEIAEAKAAPVATVAPIAPAAPTVATEEGVRAAVDK